ncbi:TetR/AcrR family transcriptional regulator [Kitasatospora viridis]|uniref:TetR family transcriptional regulator n=1 Tax=Kitasatospora viridis TaxID=281105 RepID=A0A561T717_9ACTN|nr:TetR/AcrR family transcriptional regulator [Kitasatospora viridis]TWF82904.1 TetR family transcriptional regulator [Kitasatospora viridis]
MGRPMSFEPEVAVARAMEAFWTKGYGETSPTDLAEATGVGKGSLYHCFGSKRELFAKALELYGRVGAELTEEFLARPGTAKESLRGYFLLLVDLDLEGPVRRGCLVQNTATELAGRDPEVIRTVHRIEESMIELFARRLERGQRDGDVAPELDVRAQALFLQTTLMGLRVMAKTFDRPVLVQVIDTALAGL